jgi:hypothetical protein
VRYVPWLGGELGPLQVVSEATMAGGEGDDFDPSKAWEFFEEEDEMYEAYIEASKMTDIWEQALLLHRKSANQPAPLQTEANGDGSGAWTVRALEQADQTEEHQLKGKLLARRLR